MLNFTSRAEIESCFSVLGVDSRLDDSFSDGQLVSTTEETYLDHIAWEATDLVSQYLLARYEPNRLENNRWVRRLASWVACYILSQRRGNPKQFVARYQEALIQLQAISDGHRPIFDANGLPVPVRSDLAPSHSNLVVDDRFARRKLRVQTTSSSGGTHGHQDRDYRIPWGS